MVRNGRLLVMSVLLGVALGACAKKTADLELEAARKAMADAAAKRAGDCAKETYQAAEAAIAEANRLAEAGEIDQAKSKAIEAKTLADQAAAASSKGCKEKAEEVDPNLKAQADQNIRRDPPPQNLADVLETVYFDYNEAAIREDSKAMLSKVADVLTKQTDVKIEIEGHCDVRGSTEYNLSLGERRARSVEKYLTTQGVNAGQIQIISYGEERPVDLGDTEAAHQRNRRAEIHKVK